MTTRRKFIKGAAVALPGLGARRHRPSAQSTIRWRLQTYAAARPRRARRRAGDREVQCPSRRRPDADRAFLRRPAWCPRASFSRPMQRGTIDAVQSDETTACLAHPGSPCSAATSPSPRATRSTCRCCSTSTASTRSGTRNTRKVAVKHISAGAGDPCHFPTHKGTRSLGSRTSRASASTPSRRRGVSSAQFGVVPVTLPWEDTRSRCRPASLTASPGRASPKTTRWAGGRDKLLPHQQTSRGPGRPLLRQHGALRGLPDNLKMLLPGLLRAVATYSPPGTGTGAAEADLRVNGTKLELTTIPVRGNRRRSRPRPGVFWYEIAAESETKARVVQDSSRTTTARVEPGGRPYLLLP